MTRPQTVGGVSYALLVVGGGLWIGWAIIFGLSMQWVVAAPVVYFLLFLLSLWEPDFLRILACGFGRVGGSVFSLGMTPNRAYYGGHLYRA